MNILSFICLGLKPGCKVNITFNDNRTDTCYFDGYEYYPGIIKELRYLAPVFRKQSKNGKMLSTRIHYCLDDISFVVPVENQTRLKDIEAILDASSRIENRARTTLRALVQEMNKLFPGRKIIFDTDLHGSIASTLPHNNGQGEFVDIVSLFVDPDSGAIMCDVYSECDRFNVKLDKLADTDFPALLWTTVASIKDPYLDEEYGGNFTECIDSWKDVPATVRNDTPVLHDLGIFDILRANLWFYSLPEEKRKTIDERESWITMNDGQRVITWNYWTKNED